MRIVARFSWHVLKVTGEPPPLPAALSHDTQQHNTRSRPPGITAGRYPPCSCRGGCALPAYRKAYRCECGAPPRHTHSTFSVTSQTHFFINSPLLFHPLLFGCRRKDLGQTSLALESGPAEVTICMPAGYDECMLHVSCAC